MEYFTYILYSERKNRYYVGHTSDLEGRLRRHNSNHKGYTGQSCDWQLVYFETFMSKSNAYHREREIKSWKSRKKLLELISSR